ncbi:MAG: high-potential iron-sulfur protein [Steroidobacteraceae bacterium]
MNAHTNSSRRSTLHTLIQLAAGAALSPLLLRPSLAADASLISEDEPAAKALHYVEDARQSAEAKPGETCATCSLYSGDSGSAQGTCVALNNRQVKAAGWCNAWTNM